MRKIKKMALSENTKVVLTLTNTVLIVLAIAGFIWGIASYTTSMEKDMDIMTISIDSNTCDIEENLTMIKVNEKEIDNVQIDMAKIFTELASVTDRQIRMLDILEQR